MTNMNKLDNIKITINQCYGSTVLSYIVQYLITVNIYILHNFMKLHNLKYPKMKRFV